MREIKFRGKRYDNGEWIYGDLFQLGGNRRTFIFTDEDYISQFAEKAHRLQREVDPSTVGQYTGLKDKNGKEIYEGDIICGSPQRVVGEVVYHNDRIEIKDGNPQYWVGVNFFLQEGREIIGNIHDNPELLKTE